MMWSFGQANVDAVIKRANCECYLRAADLHREIQYAMKRNPDDWMKEILMTG